MIIRSRRIAAIATAAIVLAVVGPLLYFGFVVNPHALRIVREEIPCAGLVKEPIRIVLLSDVDFPSYRSSLDRAAEAARGFDPDLVLVAGDFLDRSSALVDPGIRRAAQAWFESVPAPGRRLLAPGEVESPGLDLLRSSWSPDQIEPIANERRQFEIRGERLDVFVADRTDDPAPWQVLREGERSSAEAMCRGTESYIQLDRPESALWGDVEVTLAFRLGQADTRVLVRLTADPAADPRVGKAMIVVKDEDHPGFRLRARGQRKRELSGRTHSMYVPRTGVWTRCRIRLADDGNAARVQARFWVEGAKEPDEWAIDASVAGANRRRQGTIALGGERGRVQFADLRVTDRSGRELFRDDFGDPERFRADWKQWSRLGAWLRSPPEGAARVLLAHTPDIALDAAALGGRSLSLILAGHTHGGQVSLPGIGPLFTNSRIGRKYDRGLFRFAGTPLFITAGVGTSVVPIRLGVPPDVALLTLVPIDGARPAD